MVEVTFRVSEVDFEAAIRLFAGAGVAGSAAVLAAKALPDSAKEKLAVEYLNANAEKLEAMLESAADRKGVHVNISGARAVILDEG